MDTQDHAIYHVWIHFIPTTLYPRREKTFWSELESNPGPLASQATTLATRPWLHGLTLVFECKPVNPAQQGNWLYILPSRFLFDETSSLVSQALTTSSQCYKRFTGLYLQVCKNRAIFKIIWTELESNPGPLASQATALTTRPWLLGHNVQRYRFDQ